jgi:hypothetical protein
MVLARLQTPCSAYTMYATTGERGARLWALLRRRSESRRGVNRVNRATAGSLMRGMRSAKQHKVTQRKVTTRRRA